MTNSNDELDRIKQLIQSLVTSVNSCMRSATSSILVDSSTIDEWLVPFTRFPCGSYYVAIGNVQTIGSRLKVNFSVVWNSVGDDSKEASDEARIARFISELPSETFLHEVKTFSQLRWWGHSKTYAVDLAECFLANECFFAEPDKAFPDSLASDVKNGCIDEWLREVICLDAISWNILWSLVQSVGIEASLKEKWEYPFDSIQELFQELLRENLDDRFAVCLQNKYVFSAYEAKKVVTRVRQSFRGSLPVKKLTEKIEVRQSSTWIDRVMEVSRHLSKQDVGIAEKLKLLIGCTDKQAEMLQQSLCDPEIVRLGQVSYTWEDGKKNKGIKSASSGLPKKTRKPSREPSG